MNKNFKILAIDDDPIITRLIGYLISEYLVADISIAVNADEAIAMFDLQSFNLIITDILMKGMHGDEFIEYLRTNKIETNIIVTSTYEHFNVDRYDNIYILKKPLSTKNIVNLIIELGCPFNRENYFRSFRPES